MVKIILSIREPETYVRRFDSNQLIFTEELYVSALESLDSIEESAKEMTSPSPYISFVSLNLKVYDIYFEQQDLQYISHIGEYWKYSTRSGD